MMSIASDVLLQRVQQACAHYAASVASSTGSTMNGSSFSGLTRFEIGHMRTGSAGKGRIKASPLDPEGKDVKIQGLSVLPSRMPKW
jgi:hypothetical protein